MEAAVVSEFVDDEAPRVFVTNYAGHDYTKAEDFGKIVWITKGYVSFHSLDRVKFRVAEQVATSRSQDYLLLSGTPLISVLAVLIWYQKHKLVRLLNWDKKGDGEYREMVVTERNLTDLLRVLSDGTGKEEHRVE